MTVDYIIVGLGLAGVAFAEEVLESGKSVVVFENKSQVSSLVAGGVYNPVILKRFTPVWNGHQQLQTAIPFYKKLEKKLEKKLDNKFDTIKIFTSVSDQNNWFFASDKPTLANYMSKKITLEKINGVVGSFGFGKLTGTGRINTSELIKAYQNYLIENQEIRFETFKHNKLIISDKNVIYKNITAKKIVFCEGFGIKQNPFFNSLPLKEAKGETIDIYAPELKINFMLKSSVFVMPLKKDIYKVGATFNWTDKDSNPSEKGRKELEEKLQKVISVPYKIIDQSAGIRPTVKDRRPLVGTHQKHKQLAVLNGLGTRGVMIAPTVAKSLFNHLEKKCFLDKDIDIKRFM